MRTLEDMQPELRSLCGVLEKYSRISKMPMDFGVNEPLFPSEIHLISAVAKQGTVNITELAATFGTTKGASSQMVAKLVSKGFLEKRPDPAKRSRTLVHLTEKGRAAHNNHMKFHRHHDKPFFDFLAALSPEEYETFKKLCNEMNRWMDTYLI